MHGKLTLVLSAAILALADAGCATRQISQLDPGFVEISSTQEIERMFIAAFHGYRDPHERFEMKAIAAGDARYLFVTANLYRGPTIFFVYVFEQIQKDLWHMRAILPFVDLSGPLNFVPVGESVDVMYQGARILRVDKIGLSVQ